jgi:hypothetical protein
MSLSKEITFFLKNHTHHFGISFSHSGTTAAIERILSCTNALRTDKENCFPVEIIKAVIMAKTRCQALSFSLAFNQSQIAA